MPSMKAHFQTLALYNLWANRRLYRAVAGLPAPAFHESRGAFFGSLCGTLNHILLADGIWLERITGIPLTPRPERLDQILFADLPGLTRARENEDQRLIAHIAGLTEERFQETIRYRAWNGAPSEQHLGEILAHVFNHQTHHRGQAHTLISQFGAEAPALDLIYFLRDPGNPN
jgi:uncharacterized damage-inducible protein DinB